MRGVARRVERPVELEVESLDQDGRGVARHDGKVVFVHGALPGERVNATIFRTRRRFDEARLQHVVSASGERVAARCEHFDRCGGCSLQHLHEDAQVAHKQADVLEKIDRLASARVECVESPIVGPRWSYRRKARLGCKYVPGKGGVLIGFRERGSALVADIQSCQVLVPQVGQRIHLLRALLSRLDAREAIPQIEVAAGDNATILVVRHLVALQPADRERLSQFASDHDLCIALQPDGPDSVQALYPMQLPTLGYRLRQQALSLTFSPLEFVQVNAEVNEQLVNAALGAMGVQAGERVLDLYCGLGNFSLALAAQGAQVHGFEFAASMVARANANARANGLEHQVQVARADLSDSRACEQVVALGARRVLLDPPRSGAAQVVEALGQALPERVVYVSCNPATLARDAKVLTQRYAMRLSSLRVVDMFPHTNHVETLAVFDR